MFPNTALAIGFILLANFISKPSSYVLGKVAGILLLLYPILLTVSEVFIGLTLSQHVQNTPIGLEISAQKLFYIVFGLVILGISNSQKKHNE